MHSTVVATPWAARVGEGRLLLPFFSPPLPPLAALNPRGKRGGELSIQVAAARTRAQSSCLQLLSTAEGC